MIGIVDYGLGNLRSVAGAVERLGYEARITNSHKDLATAEKLILPGVGAFGDGMAKIREQGLDKTLNRLVVEERKPILGICLGFQLLALDSTEFGQHQGLGFIDAHVERIETHGELRLPHVGWNNLFQISPSVLFNEVPEDALFYYVHSFHVRVNAPDLVIGETEYGARLTAAMQKGNIYGTQFHPEKSQQWGLKLLQNFLEAA